MSSEVVLRLNVRRIVKKVSRTKRAPYVARLIRRIVARHMRVDLTKVKLSNSLNNYIWSRGIGKPPVKFELRLVKRDDGSILVELAGVKAAEAKAKEEQGKGQ